MKPKHIKFINEYLKNGGNGTYAYLAAYEGVTYDSARDGGSRLLATTYIKAEIQRRKTELALKVDIKQEHLVKELLEAIDSCKNEGIRNMLGEYQMADRTNWIKALQVLASICGLNVTKIETKDTTNRITIITDRFEEILPIEIETPDKQEDKKITFKITPGKIQENPDGK